MAKFIYHVEQTQEFEVEIEAANEEEAENIFSEYITDDFGNPVSSVMKVAGPYYATPAK